MTRRDDQFLVGVHSFVILRECNLMRSSFAGKMIDLDPSSLVIGANSDDGSLIFERCPSGDCVNRAMYQAYANIGGRCPRREICL